jgi:hypothetical protein
MISFHNPLNGKIQLWIGEYHIHHSTLAVILIIIGLIILLHWYYAHHAECGGWLWITKGR